MLAGIDLIALWHVGRSMDDAIGEAGDMNYIPATSIAMAGLDPAIQQ